MNKFLSKKVICLSNVYDEQYIYDRGESVARCLSSPKRRDLFRCLEMATKSDLIVLSSPPKADSRTAPRWLPAMETQFSTYRQYFCENWDVPKLRIPLSWFFYTKHVLKHTRDGDILLIDNYEFIYVISVLLARMCRRITIILDYEDGKHLIDHGWDRLLSGVAEFLGRRLLQGALLAHPNLATRLPASLPTVLVPGFVVPSNHPAKASRPVRFLYSGSLDRPRGMDLLLGAIDLLLGNNWHLDITGHGIYEKEIISFLSSGKYTGRVSFHGGLKQSEYNILSAQCHVGLNCQRSDDPISSVTFPSKIFSYLSSGLTVLSSRASDVSRICGAALLYFDEDTPESLAASMRAIIDDPESELAHASASQASHHFSLEQTAQRLREFFKKITG